MDSPLSGTSSLILEDNVSLTRLYLAWPTVPDFTVMQPAYDLLSMILADGKSSRLYKNLVYGKQIAKNVKAYQDAQEIAFIRTFRTWRNSEMLGCPSKLRSCD